MVRIGNIGARVDLEIVQGADFAKTITYKINGATTNITGYAFAAQLRTSTGVLAATFTCTILDAPNGIFSISIPKEATDLLSGANSYVWSLEQTYSSKVSELMRGTVYVYDEVTR